MKRLITLAALSLFAFGAQANDTFSHLDLTFVQSDADGDDGDGIGVEWNVTLGDSIFFNVEHSAREFDGSGGGVSGNADLKNTDIGLGYAFHLGEDGGLSPFLAIALTELEFSLLLQDGMGAGFGSASLDGYTLAAGVRYALNDRLGLGLRYRQFKFNENNADDETAIRLSVSYALSQTFGVVLRFEQYEELEVDDLHLGVRARFGGSDD